MLSARPRQSESYTPKLSPVETPRSQSFASTVERVRRLAPVMGITRVANVTGLDTIGIPVVMVCRPNSRSVSVSQGKGADLLSALASGLMEAAELYHAETITLPLRLATYEEIRFEHEVVAPTSLPRTLESRFHPHLRLLWIEGHDLLHGETVLIPFEIVHTNYTIPPPDGYGCFNATSNGLASGNHLLEATSHALCEVVERDAATLWKVRGERRLEKGRLDLTSVDDFSCQRLLEKFDNANILVAVWDITTDIGLPVFACYLMSREASEPWPFAIVGSGFGCHPSRAVALTRALTEAAQFRLTVIAGSRDDFGREMYEPCQDRPLMKAIEAVKWSAPRQHFRDVANWERASLEADLKLELECIKNAGLERVIVVDLAKKGLDLPVVRVIVPGLESMLVPHHVPGPRAQAILKM